LAINVIIEDEMPSATLNISLPEKLRTYVERKIERDGYGTISEYIRELIRADEKAEREGFDAFIAKAFESGRPEPLTKADIDNARKEVMSRLSAKNKRK
jgi:antitoxin ParD1/3/4